MKGKPWLHLLMIVTSSLTAGACGLNSVRQVDHYSEPMFGQKPTVVVLAVKARPQHGEPNLGVELARVSKNGRIIGGGCFRYDRMEAYIPSGFGGKRYFAFVVPPGIYTLTYGDAQSKAFKADGPGVYYFGDYTVTNEDPWVYYSSDLIGAKGWAKGHFFEIPRQAHSSPETPDAAHFICTP